MHIPTCFIASTKLRQNRVIAEILALQRAQQSYKRTIYNTCFELTSQFELTWCDLQAIMQCQDGHPMFLIWYMFLNTAQTQKAQPLYIYEKLPGIPT